MDKDKDKVEPLSFLFFMRNNKQIAAICGYYSGLSLLGNMLAWGISPKAHSIAFEIICNYLAGNLRGAQY